MNRRFFLQALTATTVLANHSASALLLSGSGDMIMAIFPGTAAADVDSRTFTDLTHPMTSAIAAKTSKKVYAESYRSFPLIENAIDNNHADVLFVPPTLAVHAMQHGYEPVVRVKEFLSGVMIKRKGEAVKRIAMTSSDSWPGLMGRQLVAEHKFGPASMIETVKNQEAIVYLLDRGVVQAGAFITVHANRLIATGKYEAWYPLTSTPGFTVLVHDKLAAKYGSAITQTMLSLPAPAIDGLQTLIPSAIKQFVPCSKQDYAALAKAVETALPA